MLVDLLLRGMDVEDAVERAADLVHVAALVAEEDRALVHDRRASSNANSCSQSALKARLN